MLKAAIIILSLLSLAFPHSCTKSAAWEQMDRAESVVESRPDSSLIILAQIDSTDLLWDKPKARFAILKSMALENLHIDTTSFEIIQPAIDFCLRNDYNISHGSPDSRLQTLYYQGRVYQNQGDNNRAMAAFIKAREIDEPITDSLTFARVLSAQGTIFRAINQTKPYICNNLEASRIFHSLHRADLHSSALANALYGSIISQDRERADSIAGICHKLLSSDIGLSKFLRTDLLRYYVTFGTSNEIKEMLSTITDDLSGEILLVAAQGFCEIGDAEGANRCLDAIDSTTIAQHPLQFTFATACTEELKGNNHAALQSFKEYVNQLEHQHSLLLDNGLHFAEERYHLEMATISEANSKNNIVWISIACCIILLIAIAWIDYQYRFNRTKAVAAESEKYRLTLERDNLQLEISRLEGESNSLQNLLHEQQQLEAPLKDVVKQRLAMLNSLLAKEITANDSYATPYRKWIESIHNDKQQFMSSTRLAFKASHPAFMSYLESKGLSEYEINYVCLYAIGLRGKEVGEYIQLKRHYNISSEIRHKLGINEHETNLGIYIRNLMQQLS